MIRPPRPANAVVAFPFDQRDQPLAQVEGRDHEFFHARITGQTGEGVENHRDLFGYLRIGREQTEVGINARGAVMIIAGAEMNVLAQTIGIAADDEQGLAMRLQSDHAVNDMRARFFQAARPLDVGRFIESRAQLDQRGDLFAGIGGVDQGRDDGGIAARAVKGDLEREDLRIIRGFFD